MNYSNFSNINNQYDYALKKTVKNNKFNDTDLSYNDLHKTPFLFLQDNSKYKDMAETALKGIQTKSELSDLFFSNENLERIQKKIKMDINKRTKGEFKLEADQDPNDLLIAMRAVYLEHAKNFPDQIVRQVKRLNEKVVEYVVPDMITAIKQDYGYLNEINKPLQPIMRPQNVNHGGRRSLPSVFTTFM